VRAVVGRERHEVLAVEPDPVEVREVRILSLLLADGFEPHRRVARSELAMRVIGPAPLVIWFFSWPVLRS
jgi:hypothetical protein